MASAREGAFVKGVDRLLDFVYPGTPAAPQPQKTPVRPPISLKAPQPAPPAPRMLPTLPGPGQEGAFNKPMAGLGRNASEALFAAEEGGVEPVADLVMTPEMRSGDAAARSRILSGGTDLGLEEYVPEPRLPPGTDLSTAVLPDFGAIDQQNRGVRERNLRQIDSEDAKYAQIQQGRQSDQAAIVAQQEAVARAERAAAEKALLDEFGTTDPKVIQAKQENDWREAVAEGFANDINALRSQQQEMEAAAVTPGDLEDIRAKFNREYQFRLSRYVTDLGQNLPNAAFAAMAPPKPGITIE